jgi:dihydroxy-acid dehydratase
MSLGETQMRPAAMLFRNLLAMEVEESIRGNPIDAVVLLGGCDLDFLTGSSGSTVDRESH